METFHKLIQANIEPIEMRIFLRNITSFLKDKIIYGIYCLKI